MPDAPHRPEDRERALMDAIAESVVTATDEEILEEARELYSDPSRRAAEIRSALLRALDDFEAEQTPAPKRPGLLATLAAWLATPAPRYALAALALCGGVALAVLLWQAEPKVPEIAHVNPTLPDPTPTPQPPTPQPPTPQPPTPQPPRPRPNGKAATPELPGETYPVLRTPLPPGVRLEDVKSVCVNFDSRLESPGEAVTRLRDAIATKVAAAGFTPAGCADADARIALSQESPARLKARLIVNGKMIWEMAGPASGGPDAHAERVAAELVKTVRPEGSATDDAGEAPAR